MRKALMSLGLCTALIFSGQAMAEARKESASAHEHSHNHTHKHDKDIYNGYFKDSQIKDRKLSDWDGDWKSVYHYLKDGTLDPVFAHKAESGDKSAEQYRDYYDIGYRTDTARIVIKGDEVSFYNRDKVPSGKYASDGYEVLKYAKGNRGVRFIFKKIEGDKTAPEYIQFSDHRIAPEKADHYHLYWGDDRSALLKEVTNWPTYYPSSLSGKDIAHEMMHH